jgi:hypothetical protein
MRTGTAAVLAERVGAVTAASHRTGWRDGRLFRLLRGQETIGLNDCGKTNGDRQKDEGPDSFHVTLAASEPYEGEYAAEEMVQSLERRTAGLVEARGA